MLLRGDGLRMLGLMLGLMPSELPIAEVRAVRGI